MIVFEGADGAGKTSLMRSIHNLTGMSFGPRASESLTGPVDDPWGWAVTDIYNWPYYRGERGTLLYDRHPLISEPIYGPICRDKLDPRFEDPKYSPVWDAFKAQALIVLCMPPFGEVQKNIMNDQVGQMSGVQQYRKELYDAYESWAINHMGDDYTGVIYDYTSDPNGPDGIGIVQTAILNYLLTRSMA